MREEKDMRTIRLESDTGLRAAVSTAGAAVLSLCMPEALLGMEVLLGDEDSASRLAPGPMFGATIGRCAGRIRDGRLPLAGGKTVQLTKNAGANHCHGGARGFDKRVFSVERVSKQSVELYRISADGEEGYPGTLAVHVRFALNGNSLKIRYQAICDCDTAVSLSNHLYFNLAGGGAVDTHQVMIRAGFISGTDADGVPDGRRIPVEGTAFDFNALRPIGSADYDHNYLLGAGSPAATMVSPGGLVMRVKTDLPAIQFYVADFSGFPLRESHRNITRERCGVCFEPQFTPNAVNLSKEEKPILKAGETYRHDTTFSFSRMGG